MIGKVLLINHGAALMTDTLVSSLRSAEIEVVQVEPNIDEIRPQKDSADILVLFAGDFVYRSPDLLLYLKDICFGEEKLMCVVGYTKEIAEIEETIPKSMIEKEFLRPIDVKNLAMTLRTLADSSESRKKEKHILLVDDDTVFLKMMQSWLGKKYRITVVRSGMQAITYIAAHVPDLILLDYEMPVTTGPKVLEMIRSEKKSADIPVIFLTGKSDRESVMSVMSLKPEGYLLKSMSKERILASIDHFFESRKWENADAAPAKPGTPAAPAKPGTPAASAKPGTPAASAKPGTPAAPAKPAASRRRAMPSEFSISAKPGSPQKGGNRS